MKIYDKTFKVKMLSNGRGTEFTLMEVQLALEEVNSLKDGESTNLGGYPVKLVDFLIEIGAIKEEGVDVFKGEKWDDVIQELTLLNGG